MSVKVTTWVWEQSRSRGPARLVLLAIADNAHDDGAQAWPSTGTLVRKTGLAERTVHRAIKQLVSMGELEVRYNAGPGLCNLYRVRMTPAPLTPPSEMHPRQPDTPVRDAGVSERHPTPVREAPLPPSERHPEPSLEPSLNRPPPHPESYSPPAATRAGSVEKPSTSRRQPRRARLVEPQPIADAVAAIAGGRRPPAPAAAERRWREEQDKRAAADRLIAEAGEP